ncbi:hypothetical protein SKAU_G00318750 [Synaphobranchus kaupii]|uniref:Uncharacterized protein n=1 Tax=Synaphobranchus kaupii TaxID=118154 RepID=A0A9Q1IL16_SYNKA|nr:hypothetical protein SKAU_G00318750 [Synaphobranchus kaupii]
MGFYHGECDDDDDDDDDDIKVVITIIIIIITEERRAGQLVTRQEPGPFGQWQADPVPPAAVLAHVPRGSHAGPRPRSLTPARGAHAWQSLPHLAKEDLYLVLDLLESASILAEGRFDCGREKGHRELGFSADASR